MHKLIHMLFETLSFLMALYGCVTALRCITVERNRDVSFHAVSMGVFLSFLVLQAVDICTGTCPNIADILWSIWQTAIMGMLVLVNIRHRRFEFCHSCQLFGIGVVRREANGKFKVEQHGK